MKIWLLSEVLTYIYTKACDLCEVARRFGRSVTTFDGFLLQRSKRAAETHLHIVAITEGAALICPRRAP